MSIPPRWLSLCKVSRIRCHGSTERELSVAPRGVYTGALRVLRQNYALSPNLVNLFDRRWRMDHCLRMVNLRPPTQRSSAATLVVLECPFVIRIEPRSCAAFSARKALTCINRCQLGSRSSGEDGLI